MIHIRDILTLDRTLYSVVVNSKKKALELIADTIANSVLSVESHTIFDALIARERLGSTAIGHGIALPHARLEQIDQILGCFIFLKESIDFDAEDHIHVDMLFAFIVPQKSTIEHLELLTSIAHIFLQESTRKNLQLAASVKDLYERLQTL